MLFAYQFGMYLFELKQAQAKKHATQREQLHKCSANKLCLRITSRHTRLHRVGFEQYHNAQCEHYGKNQDGHQMISCFLHILLFFFKQCSVSNRATQCHLVGIFQLVAHSYTPGNHTYLDACRSQFAVDVKVGCVALHRWTQGQNHLLYRALGHALYQRVDLDIGRPHAVHR